MDKVCLECGEKIKGRIDKKFCSDCCRNSYNNKLNSNSSGYVKNVNAILRKNRRILEELTLGRTAKASEAKLLERGFNFHYYTNTYTTQKGVKYYFCYEYGYTPLEKKIYFLVKRKENEEYADRKDN